MGESEGAAGAPGDGAGPAPAGAASASGPAGADPQASAADGARGTAADPAAGGTGGPAASPGAEGGTRAGAAPAAAPAGSGGVPERRPQMAPAGTGDRPGRAPAPAGSARAAGGSAASDRPAPPGAPGARPYDFRIPDKFPKDVLRQISHLHDGMSRTLTTSLSARLRTTVRVEDARAEQTTYDRFVRDASNPAVLAAFSAEPLKGSALLEIDPVVAFPMIDRLLGGSGESLGIARPVTEIELTVIGRVLSTILDNWREAWSHVITLRPRVLGVETNPMFAQLAAPSEIVLAVTLTCGLGRQEGRLRFCFPFAMIEPLAHGVVSRQWVAAVAEPPGSHEAEIRDGLGSVLVPVSAEIARARLTLGQILAMRPGDVLPLGVPAGAPVCLRVRGQPRFTGRVGRRGSRLAVQILGSREEERS